MLVVAALGKLAGSISELVVPDHVGGGVVGAVDVVVVESKGLEVIGWGLWLGRSRLGRRRRLRFWLRGWLRLERGRRLWRGSSRGRLGGRGAGHGLLDLRLFGLFRLFGSGSGSGSGNRRLRRLRLGRRSRFGGRRGRRDVLAERDVDGLGDDGKVRDVGALVVVRGRREGASQRERHDNSRVLHSQPQINWMAMAMAMAGFHGK